MHISQREHSPQRVWLLATVVTERVIVFSHQGSVSQSLVVLQRRLSRGTLAGMIDHALLSPNVTRGDILRGCKEAKQLGLFSVCVNPAHVQLAARALEGSNVRVCSVVSFPFGLSTTDSKIHEARMALADGAVEIDMVMNNVALRSNQALLVREDIAGVVQAAKAVKSRTVVKVILENCYLTDEQKVEACRIAVQAGADFVKTSTGFGTGGATVKDVQLMSRTVGPEVGVKAAGGVRSVEQVMQMIEAGATRIGTSSSVAVMRSLEE